ncbi:MAG TPA: twin-arginine translocation signal domain-containing protein, partial [Anaerolineales bacterium]|nr:twin-arginine translocation signal domain-containing protein [Anaerolineales bacterium]
MNQNFSRRDFLKIAGAGLGALAFAPRSVLNLEELMTPRRLPQFPASAIIGRVVDPGIDLRSRPTNDPAQNSSIAKLAADTLVEWNRQVLGSVIGGLTNQRYVETPQGYIYSSVLHPTRNLPNTPLTEMPTGLNGFWAEV